MECVDFGKLRHKQAVSNHLSAKRYYERYRRSPEEHGSAWDEFVGIEWEVIRDTAVSIPSTLALRDDAPSNAADEVLDTLETDGLLLYFHTEEERQAWERKVEDNIERVRAHVYTHVHECM